MFKWLSKYIRRIDFWGVGVELREHPDVAPSGPTLVEKPAAQNLPRPESADGAPRPLPIERVVSEADLVGAIRQALEAMPPRGDIRGITIGKPGHTRALIYIGPIGKSGEGPIRDLAKPYGYNVSPVRDLSFAGTRTATLDDPMEY